MKIFLLIMTLLGVVNLSACSDHDHGNEHTHSHSHEAEHGHGENGHGHDHGPGSEVVTHFNNKTELFVEFPVLRAGEVSEFVAHLTWLQNYRAVNEGRLTVVLLGGDEPEELFSATVSGTAGIFRPKVEPVHSGERELLLKLEAGGQTSLHRLGKYTVYDPLDEIPEQAHEDENESLIPYLKEQQWQTDFAIAEVMERRLRESIPTMAVLRPATNLQAVLSAPHDGQLGQRGKRYPVVGDKVRKGQVLAVVGNRLGRDLDGRVSGSALRSPIDGVVAQMKATPGAYLRQGDMVYHIVDNRTLWLEVQIPEVDVPHVKKVIGAWIVLPGLDDPLIIDTEGSDANGKVVAFGKVVDPVTRTAPLFLSFSNPDQQLRIGTYADARVFTGHESMGPTVPASALVNDNGLDVVYVMKHGEAFERRVVKLGIRDGQYVEIINGVNKGERVVSRGAYLVKLAATGGDQIGHGHAH